ncbi:MAG TPA: anti-sigma factor [Pseudolabrys sp.]|jgi:anti-sigma factor RsiW|nr:anti-sigma factor [Pseudolabrys sp.]
MIDRDSPVTEDELHAYIDGELPADRMEAVTAWLAAHPEQAVTVASWRAQSERIRARFGAVLEEVVPERLTLDQIIRNDRANGRSWKAFAAAAVIAFLAGGATGWFAHGASIGTRSGSFAVANGALDAYRLYVVEVRHPVEVPGTERQHMTQWLSKRVGEELRVPDLQSVGLKLVGGRLLPGPTGAAAFYMYEGTSGERFTIYCAKASAPPSAFRYTAGERAAAFYWADGKVAYVVSGPADREKLEKVAKAAYEQMESDDAKRS